MLAAGWAAGFSATVPGRVASPSVPGAQAAARGRDAGTAR